MLRRTGMTSPPLPLRAVTVLLLGALALAACGDETTAPGTAQSAPTAPPSSEPVSTDGWRTEVWHDLELQVPADWALGYAPVQQDAEVLDCAVGPAGSDGSDTTPYVGRPGYGSDVCSNGDLAVPEQDFVWFGSLLQPRGHINSPFIRCRQREGC